MIYVPPSIILYQTQVTYMDLLPQGSFSAVVLQQKQLNVVFQRATINYTGSINQVDGELNYHAGLLTYLCITAPTITSVYVVISTRAL